jgi:DNA-binding transcriptional MocR family regulator
LNLKENCDEKKWLLGFGFFSGWTLYNRYLQFIAVIFHVYFQQNGVYMLKNRSHIQKLRKQYNKKGTILKQAYLDHILVGTSFSGGNSGFYSTIKLPGRMKAKDLAQHLKKKNVLVQDATNMYLPPYRKENRILLSVSQVEDQQISEGVKKIGEGIRELSSR